MAETKTQTLDDDLVGALETPEGKKEIIVWDDMVLRFGVRVSRSGMRSWIVRYRGVRPGGEKGSRQLVIGRHGEMPIEDARQKAREVLAKAESEEEAHGRPEEPAAGPEPAAAPSRNDAAVETEPGGGVEAEATAEAELSAEEEYDREPGEVFSTASEAGAVHSHDDGLDLENTGTAVGPGPEAAADEDRVTDRDPDVDQAIGNTIGWVGGGAGQDGVEPDPYTADAPARPVGHAEEPPADRRDSDGDGVSLQARREGGDMAGARQPEEDSEDDGQQEPADSVDAAEARAERPKLPGFVDATKAMVRTVGKAVGGVAGMVRKGGAEEATDGGAEEPRREAEAAGEPPPRSPRPAEAPAAEERANREDVAEAAARAKQQEQDAEAAGDETRAGRDFSDATLAGLAENLDHVRGEIDRMSATNREFGPRLDKLTTAMSVSTKDFRQRRRRRVRAVLAMAAMLALGIGGGVALQSRVEVAPQADPTLGWKDHVWNYYGEAFMGCFQRAKKTESGYADCTMKVRAR